MGIFSRKNSTKDIPIICDVDLERYLGTWYEIARLPAPFESGLENVTATYTLGEKGELHILNAGLKNGQRKEARATARVPDPKCTGRLQVSFFKPLKSAYKIIGLDQDGYSYAVVTGRTKNYLWILSRTPRMSSVVYKRLLAKVGSQGFDTSKIIKTVQNKN